MVSKPRFDYFELHHVGDQGEMAHPQGPAPKIQEQFTEESPPAGCYKECRFKEPQYSKLRPSFMYSWRETEAKLKHKHFSVSCVCVRVCARAHVCARARACVWGLLLQGTLMNK